MSDWNSLETELQRWKPRQPSPELKRRIFFAPESSGGAAAVNFAELWRWMVPALGCFLLVVASLSSHLPNSALVNLASTNALLPIQQSNEQHAAFISQSSAHCEKNSLPATKLEWRFGPRASSGLQNFIHYTNKLIR